MKNNYPVMPFHVWLGLLLMSAGVSGAAPGDEHWDVAFGWPGSTNYVYSIAQHKGVLYAGGQPTSGTNVNICAFDGSHWSGLGLFSGTGTPTVYDLAFVGDTLYAAGFFSSVDGAPIKGLARWDGNTWSSVGGFSGNAYALAVDGNNLYVGGNFTNAAAGGVSVTNVGYWDGAAWHALGGGVGQSGDVVLALAMTNGVLYAGGRFTNTVAPLRTNLAVWNGSSWAAVGAAPNDQIRALAFKGSDLYAAGYFTQFGSLTANGVAKWNGASWSALGTGLSGGMGGFSLTVFGDRVCVAGYFTSAGGVASTNLALWDGAAWVSPGLNITGTGSALVARAVTLGTNLYIGGLLSTVNGVFVNQLACWDGTTWKFIGNPACMNGLTSIYAKVFASDGPNVYVGGAFSAVGQIRANRIARWDGTNWHALGDGLNGNVSALAVGGGNLYVGGSFTTAGGVPATHLARWDGANWYAVGGGITGTVSALAMSGNDLLVGGNFQFTASDRVATAIARWDGYNWWAFGGWLFMVWTTGPGVDAIAVNGTDVYLGGNFSAGNESSGQTSLNIVRYDGVDWQPMGSGVNTNVYAISLVGSDVYVGGTFTNASGVAANRIARWDGANWNAVGGGVTGSGSYSVSSLAAIGPNLYAGGTFTNAGGLAVNRIAKWDGSAWSALGSGMTYPSVSSASVSGLAAYGSDLYVGGIFTLSGTKPSYYVARWKDSWNFDVPPTLQLSKLRRSSNTFKFGISTTNVSSYVIETSTNLSTWTHLETNSATYYEFWDTQATSPRRFYRAHGL